MRVALVHDFLREYGGAERVVETIHEMWPTAPLYTSFVDWPSFAKAPAGKVELFKSWDIRTSWVQHNWVLKRFHSPLRFLAPKIWESFDLSGYDVVISSSGWFMCRGVITKAGRRNNPTNPTNTPIRPINKSMKQWDNETQDPLHICYIHHPPRNLYGYATGSDLQKYWPVRAYATIINFFLRHYDYETAQKVDYFIANSKETARRVEKFYRRESTVIYPPVVIEPRTQNSMTKKEKSYFLSVGRLTYAKRVDLAIVACNKMKLPLKIVGKGKEEAWLRSIAGPTIEFVGGVSDEELDRLYSDAKALIFCALDEDFGMVPVEAMARGVPVIALGQGGVLETVIHKKTGLLFHKPYVEDLIATIKQFNNPSTSLRLRSGQALRAGITITPEACIAQAKKFSKERFKKELKAFVEKACREALSSK